MLWTWKCHRGRPDQDGNNRIGKMSCRRREGNWGRGSFGKTETGGEAWSLDGPHNCGSIKWRRIVLQTDKRVSKQTLSGVTVILCISPVPTL